MGIMTNCIKKSKKKCKKKKNDCIWVQGNKRRYCRKSNKKKIKNYSLAALKKFGIRKEIDFVNSLIDDDHSKIIKWICQNIPYVLEMHKKIIGEKTYILFKVGYFDPVSKSEKFYHKYIITTDEHFGKGSWGTVSKGYIYDKSFYNKKSIVILAKNLKKIKRKGFNKKIRNTSHAFWLLLKHDKPFFNLTLEKGGTTCAIKIPNQMETDSE